MRAEYSGTFLVQSPLDQIKLLKCPHFMGIYIHAYSEVPLQMWYLRQTKSVLFMEVSIIHQCTDVCRSTIHCIYINHNRYILVCMYYRMNDD